MLIVTTAPTAAFAQPGANSVGQEIKSQVGGKLRPIYAARGFWPLWVKNGTVTPSADKLLSYLESAEADGLNPRDYDAANVRAAVERARDGTPRDLTRAELALSQAFARYVRDVRRAPNAQIRYLDEELVPRKMSDADVLRGAALAPNIDTYIDTMGWMDPAYVGLRSAMAEREARWNRLPDIRIPAGAMLRSGASGERVRLLRERLDVPGGARFDKQLAAAVADFQAAHGLKADGVAGAGTIEALNRSPGWYDRKLAINLDRARLLPGPGTRHITVNIAAQQLIYYEDGVEAGRMKVVVGKPDEQTPLLAGMVRYATLNPYWNVPPDLTQRKVASGLFNGRSLRKLGFEALSGWDAGAETLDPAQVDWSAVKAGQQELRIRQLPGPSNAMGKMKFMFPNDLGIYLHDTPERVLFTKSSRYFSSGCVRLEDASRLGTWLFGKPLATDGSAPEQNVALPRPVPVYLTYLTAQATSAGVTYFDDAYDKDDGGSRQVASR